MWTLQIIHNLVIMFNVVQTPSLIKRLQELISYIGGNHTIEGCSIYDVESWLMKLVFKLILGFESPNIPFFKLTSCTPHIFYYFLFPIHCFFFHESNSQLFYFAKILFSMSKIKLCTFSFGWLGFILNVYILI